MTATADVRRLDWRTLFHTKEDATPEFVAALDDYFVYFAQPPFTVDDDGRNNIGKQPCLKCSEPLNGDMVDVLIGKGGFRWGLVHGEGFCQNCKWPARAHHFVKDKDGKDVITIRNVILQYHPDFVTKRTP